MKIHLTLPIATLCTFLAAISEAADTAPLPRALDVPGVHSYAQKIVAAGDTLQFRTSATVPYQLSICRLGPQIDDPSAGGMGGLPALAEAQTRADKPPMAPEPYPPHPAKRPR